MIQDELMLREETDVHVVLALAALGEVIKWASEGKWGVSEVRASEAKLIRKKWQAPSETSVRKKLLCTASLKPLWSAGRFRKAPS